MLKLDGSAWTRGVSFAAAVAAVLLGGVTQARADEPADAAHAYWNKVGIVCGGATYLRYGVNLSLFEVRGAQYTLEADPPSPAERLNGMEWRILGWSRSPVYRSRSDGDGAWERWADDAELVVHIQKVNGQVTFNGRALSEFPDHPSCGSAEVQEGAYRPPSAPPPPISRVEPQPDPMAAALAQESMYLGTPYAAAPNVGETWWVGQAPLRSSPSVGASIITLLPTEMRVRVDGVQGHWAQVFVPQGNGHSFSGFLVMNFLYRPPSSNAQ